MSLADAKRELKRLAGIVEQMPRGKIGSYTLEELNGWFWWLSYRVARGQYPAADEAIVRQALRCVRSFGPDDLCLMGEIGEPNDDPPTPLPGWSMFNVNREGGAAFLELLQQHPHLIPPAWAPEGFEHEPSQHPA